MSPEACRAFHVFRNDDRDGHAPARIRSAPDDATGHDCRPLQPHVDKSSDAANSCLGQGGYNRGMDEKESVGPEQSTPVAAEIEVFEGFVSAGLKEEQALRATQAVREQAGHNINETLEVHRREVNTRVDGAETNLTAKIDGVDSKVDAAKTELTAKIDGAETNLTAKIDVSNAEQKAETAKLHTELKAMRKELSFYRWGLLLLFAVLTFLVAYGLLPSIRQWFWPESTPAQSLQAPVESDPPEPAVPPQTDPPEPTPQ